MTWTTDRKLRAAIEAPLGPSAVMAGFSASHRRQRGTSSVDEHHAERVIDEVIATYRALGKLAFLRARGIDYAVTQAREATSAPILEHLGFETLFRGRCYVLD